ncbi:unnamed protein product [Pieris brassicae]|uniref:FLYWCH-type domain-containing protein n=1 Tax=Pieris brassicae TaxID=7116 RepID=A0A9P0SUI4_PIEBR|nr:unnamed protein product [Pieris brassicae]
MEISTSPEGSSNAITVQVDNFHHRHCSQLSASITTTSHLCGIETEAMSYLYSIHRGYPRTAAERMQEYRARKKKETLIVTYQKHKKSDAERAKAYRTRKNAKIQSAVRYGVSQRGNPILMVGGNRFKKTSGYGKKSWWHCIKRSSTSCPASMSLDGNCVVRVNFNHNHQQPTAIRPIDVPIIR